MAQAPGLVLAAVFLLISPELHHSSPLPLCPDSCTCQRDSLLNCSSSGLSLVPQHIQDSVTELDLSHNLLESFTLHQSHHKLQKVWLGNNSITHLSLCVERNLEAQYVRGRCLHRLRPWRRRGFISWAPTLQLLSVERNHLVELPEGLRYCTSLQVLQLSFNRISTLQSEDFSSLQQLKELHLQNNLITNIHPRMFQHLDQLRVLDLSFNMLTSIHPLMYPSLRNLGLDVRLSGNSWQCDCNMRSLQSWLASDSRKGLQTWSVLCASPSAHSGRDLLQVPKEDLNCYDAENRPELHQDMTVNKGSGILLTCPTQDPLWWTPYGQASVTQPEGGLLISDITEADTGLYVCVSESEQKIVSVYNLQISETGGTKRKARSLPQYSQEIIPPDYLNRMGQTRAVSQSNLALAVSLSVIITFLIAFILGVLARPFICTLWGRVTKKKNPSAPDSVPSEVQQYDNEAFASGEDPEDIQPQRERRVTFSDVPENITVQYYDTVGREDQESLNSDVFENEPREAEKHKHTDGDSENNGKEKTIVSGVTGADRTGTVEYEHIPDQERTSLSSHSSLSDTEDKKDRGDHSTDRSLHVSEDDVQQTADLSTVKTVEEPQITINDGDEIPGFSSEPFTDWSPHDKWRDGEEQFDFSDSVRSTSARSSIVNGSFNDPKLIVRPSLDKHGADSMSSSSSSISDDEPTHYTVNSDSEDEQNTERYRNHRLIHNINPGLTDVSLSQDATPVMRTENSFSSHSSESEDEQMQYKVQQDTKEEEEEEKGLGLGDISSKHPLEDKAPSEVSSSSSDSEIKIKDLKVGKENKINKSEPLLTDHHPPQNISAQLPVSGSSSSDESEDGTIKLAKKQEVGEEQMGTLDAMKDQWPALDVERIPSIKRRLDIKILPSSDSKILKDNAAPINKHEEGGAKVLLPTLDLVQIKRPLDEKAPSTPHESSSSSDSEDETINQGVKLNQKMKFPNQESKTGTEAPDPDHDVEHVTPSQMHFDRKPSPLESDSSSSSDSENESKFQIKMSEVETHWPETVLKGTTVVKRRLDIKAPSPPPELSSSSDIEDEDVKVEQEKLHLAKFPNQQSPSLSSDPRSKWPSFDLKQIPPIKRSLDIKSPSHESDSSSSSDSDVERVNPEVRQQQEKPVFTKLPSQPTKTVSHEPESKWPTLDLEHIPSIKRRLDIQTSTEKFDSSSSSDSEDDTTHHYKKPRPKEGDISKPLFQEPQKVIEDKNTWPALDLGRVTPLKRRLDIKASSTPPESSHSESDNGRKQMPQEQGMTGMEMFPNKESKRPLDIKSPSRESSSSSSSDSDGERANHEVKLPYQASKTVSHEPESKWPTLDLEHIPPIKRSLDIKSPSHESDSSSSSDSDVERVNPEVRQQQEKPVFTKLPNQPTKTVSHEPESKWPTLDLEHIPSIKRRLDIQASTTKFDSSSSSDSEDDTIHHHEKPRPKEGDISKPLFQEPQKVIEDKNTWPALDLGRVSPIKRRLDIKASSTPPESSHSESDNGRKQMPQEQGMTGMEMFPNKESKRRLDIKSPSQESSSSSSSDSDGERANHEVKLPYQASKTVSHEPESKWPTLDLEHIPSIKRCLDIKAPSAEWDSPSNSDSEDEATLHRDKSRPKEGDTAKHQPHHLQSSSSSDSEDDRTTQKVKQKQEETIYLAKVKNQESITVSHDPETQWPALHLEQVTKIKRRLDIKAPSPESDSSCSGDSKDKTTHNTEKHDLETHWPSIDLEHGMHLKRRLDIKAPTPDSSSSSDSENETPNYYEKQEQSQEHKTELPIKVPQTVSNNPDKQWPVVNLEHNIRVKRTLDIKLASSSSSSTLPEEMNTTRPLETKPTSPLNDPSSSSDSESETAYDIVMQKPRQTGITSPAFQGSPTGHVPQLQRPFVDLNSITQIKRRLDIKAPPPPPDSLTSGGSSHPVKMEEINKMSSSSSSDEQEAVLDRPLTMEKPKTYMRNVSDPYIKRRLNIRAPPQPGDSSNSDTDSKPSSPTVKYESNEGDGGIIKTEHQTMLHNSGIPQISRRLDIKAPSQQPDAVLSDASSGSSSSDSDDENRNRKAKLGIQASAISKSTQKEFIRTPKTPMMIISQSPKTSNVKLEKYIAITDDFGSNTTTDSRDTTPESSQELHSRWATMNLGISRFRKRLDIMSRTNEPAPLPSSPLPDPHSSSSSNSESESGEKSVSKTKTSLKDQVDTSVKVKEPLRTDFSPPTNWERSNQDIVTGFGVQRVNRHLDIKVREKTAATPAIQQRLDRASSSDSKRAANIKASSPKESSPSSSEDETASYRVADLTSGIPRVKRSLHIKAPSPPPSDSSSSFSESEVGYESKLTSLTEQPIIQYKRTIIKASLPATSTSSGTDGQWQRNKEAGKLDLTRDNSSSGLGFDDIVKRKIQQPKHSADAGLPPSIRWTGISSSLYDHSAPSLGTRDPPTVPDHSHDSSNHANDISRTSPKERKGLSALKAMSSVRREWDIEHDHEHKSLFVDGRSQSGTSLVYQTSETLLSQTSERSPADMLYNVSRYKRHLIENTGPPQEAPPPVPATPPPDEAVELTWSSSQSRSYLQQRRSMTSKPQDLHFDSPNISEV